MKSFGSRERSRRRFCRLSDEWLLIRSAFQLIYLLIALALCAAFVFNDIFCILDVTNATSEPSGACALLVRLHPSDLSKDEYIVIEREHEYHCVRVISSGNGCVVFDDGNGKTETIAAQTVLGRAEQVVFPLKKLGRSPSDVLSPKEK